MHACMSTTILYALITLDAQNAPSKVLKFYKTECEVKLQSVALACNVSCIASCTFGSPCSFIKNYAEHFLPIAIACRLQPGMLQIIAPPDPESKEPVQTATAVRLPTDPGSKHKHNHADASEGAQAYADFLVTHPTIPILQTPCWGRTHAGVVSLRGPWVVIEDPN